MAYIRSDFLFNSERLAACSDDAQSHWLRFYLLANAFARFQIDYAMIIRTAYALFQQRPTREQISGWLREYYDHFLLFIYDDPKTGNLWGQWLTDETDFRRHATSEELKSPAPDANQFERFRRAYVAQNRAKSHSLLTLSGIPPHSCLELELELEEEKDTHTRAGARKSSGDESSDDDDSAGADTREGARKTSSGDDARVSSSPSSSKQKQKAKPKRAIEVQR